MSTINFMLQDVLGTALAFLLFPLVTIFPGYVVAWVFDLFDFRQRLQLTKFVIAIVISLSLSPILVYLFYKLISSIVTLLMLGIFMLIFGKSIIHQATKQQLTWKKIQKISRYQMLAIFVGIGWIIFTVLSLIDIQWNNRLYYTAVSYDLTTRVAVIDAITRTGVPPINPSYFPGHPVYLTFLYYFWYVLCSLIDQIGGNLVSARTAMIASIAWCGLGLMAVVALYLRLRSPDEGEKTWKSALLGIGFLSVSGLDFIPALTNMMMTRLILGSMWPQGDIEHWNEQITAWTGSIFWVPHHVAAMIACMTGLLLVQFSRQKTLSSQIPAMTLTGLAFASAVGLSTWVTGVFALFWGIWMIKIWLEKKEKKLVALMLYAGVIAVVAASSFLIDLLQPNGSNSHNFPFIFEVRRYVPVISYIDSLGVQLKNIINFFLLPVNYGMELGFFCFIAILWLKKKEWRNHPFSTHEIILLLVVVFIGSFVRSQIIGNNDLGWRCWLFGQFVLLIWAVDIFNKIVYRKSQAGTTLGSFQARKVERVLMIFMLCGILTTITDMTFLRTWPVLIDMNIAGFPNGMSPDTQLGPRTLAARLGYNYIRENLPANTIIQYNSTLTSNRPAGLYSSRQMAISDLTAYGVPLSDYKDRVKQIGAIFLARDMTSWTSINLVCDKYSINAIIIDDLDPLWQSKAALEQLQPPLYQNEFYAVFKCGTSANSSSK